MNASRATSSPQRQAITPELRRWIVEQAQAGHAPESVLQAMRASGWDEDVAIEAMESSLSEHLAQLGTAAVVPVPEPDLSGDALYLDLPDRRVHVLSVVQHPRVVVFGNVLSDDECDALIDAARPRLARSLTVATRTGGEEVNEDRTSQGMFFQRGESALIRRIEARLAAMVRWPVERGEGLQVLNYGPGAEYKPHYDYFDPSEPGTPTIVQRGGQRVGTIVMYLAEPVRGGATIFPDIQLAVAPKRGNAVFFSYAQPHPATGTLHGGAPVLEGEKWIATKWMRERTFE